jgi:hypothetical protein
MVEKHLQLLGMRVVDRVTKFAGVVSSISFDLYGCIQVVVNPGLDKDGKPMESMWFDVSRLEVKSAKPVMQRPDYLQGRQAEGKQGCADKPKGMKN